MTLFNNDTIVALASPSGNGALALLRVSGPDAFVIADSVWRGATLSACKSHTAHLGCIIDENGNILDQALATVFVAPNSFTGENSVEFSLHGSPWIVREVVNLVIRRGARGALPGEFSRRAYLNGKMDLASAEGVADLIASSSKAAHSLAMQQTRGAFSKEFNALRDALVNLASLLELELDFSEEDVEFADRSSLLLTSRELLSKIERLTGSYSAGRAFKEGVPVVIAGVPNVGKSTLLNALLDEERAIVSEIPGTTRDVIEDTCEIDGVLFRFSDTAGLRESSDVIENIGIGLARERLAKASVVLWLIDPFVSIDDQLREMNFSLSGLDESRKVIPVVTKTSAEGVSEEKVQSLIRYLDEKLATAVFWTGAKRKLILTISTVEDEGLDGLRQALKDAAMEDYNPEKEIVLTNARHYSDLLRAGKALRAAIRQIEGGASADFIAMDIREATDALSSLTGSITTPDLLNSIFSRFCIGK